MDGSRPCTAPASSAAFWAAAAAALPRSDITLDDVGLNPTRIGYLALLQRIGARVELIDSGETGGEPRGSLRVRHGGNARLDLGTDDVPGVIDELPVLAVAACFAEGTTVIRDAGELRLKESDRIATTTAGLRALGAGVQDRPDGLRIDGGGGLRGARLDSYGDHRLAMALAVAALGRDRTSALHRADAAALFVDDVQQTGILQLGINEGAQHGLQT